MRNRKQLNESFIFCGLLDELTSLSNTTGNKASSGFNSSARSPLLHVAASLFQPTLLSVLTVPSIKRHKKTVEGTFISVSPH